MNDSAEVLSVVNFSKEDPKLRYLFVLEKVLLWGIKAQVFNKTPFVNFGKQYLS